MEFKKKDLAINVEGLCKRFGSIIAVNDLSLKIERGEIFGFFGPNGSGKTTCIRLLCGLLTPDSGVGTCLDYDIIKDSLEIKRLTGYMSQKFSLYDDLTLRENLDFVARMYKLDNRQGRVDESLDKLKIDEVNANQLAGNLSGGWKQRLSLAAATIHQPQLLLLDEPTAGVDPKARREFWDSLYRFSSEGITALVSTHYMDEAELCNSIGYIAYGKLLLRGTAEGIVEKAKLSTWSLKGKDLTGLSEKLKSLEGVDQVTVFGNALHVSGQDSEKLEQALETFTKEEYKWERIKPSLEDVFINELLHAKEPFNQ